MNSENLKENKEKNSYTPISGYQEIGDFCLEKCESDKKIIDNAKVGYSVYGVENIEELKNTTKKIVVVIPALTGTSKIFNDKPSQGDGWANTYGEEGNILDPKENIVIGLDYFGSGFNNHPQKHNLDFYPVPPEKQVEAWKKALKRLGVIGVKKIDRLIGGSNGGGHIHHWALDKNRELEPNILIPVAGPISPTSEAKEFFQIQLDFLEGENISERLKQNLENLKGKSELYDILIKETIREINEYKNSNKNIKREMKIVRQIGFLKFVGPKFFDKFHYNKNGNKLDSLEKAKENMMNYFEKEGVKFEKRFGKSYLKILLKGIVNSQRITPEEYAKKISKKINIIIISIEDDKLFDKNSMQEYFLKIKNLRKIRGDIGNTIFKIIKSTPKSLIASHDYFLWKEGGKEISDSILEEINN